MVILTICPQAPGALVVPVLYRRTGAPEWQLYHLWLLKLPLERSHVSGCYSSVLSSELSSKQPLRLVINKLSICPFLHNGFSTS